MSLPVPSQAVQTYHSLRIGMSVYDYTYIYYKYVQMYAYINTYKYMNMAAKAN